MSKVTDFVLAPGHLDKNSESKINDTAVVNGQVIYSEKSGLQFIDYADKRHTYGSVLTGVYNNSTGFVDFSTTTLGNALDAIKTNGLVNDGQNVKIGNNIYQYRCITSNKESLITKIDESQIYVEEEQIGYIIYLPEHKSGDLVNVDILMSITNEEFGTKLMLVKIVNNSVKSALCQDLDGVFDYETAGFYIEYDSSGLFLITVAAESTFKVISYTVNSSGSSKSEGLYVAAIDW